MFQKIFSKIESSLKKNIKASKIICIGSSSKDIFFPTEKGIIFDTPEDITSQKKIAFELGAKYQVTERFEAVGGCAANVACGLSNLGISVQCCTKIGDDSIGEWIEKQLALKGVGVDLLQKENNCKSDLSSIIVDVKTGERIIFSDRDANEKLEIFKGDMQGADWIFISSLNGSWQDNLKKILDIAKKNKSKIIFNPGQRNIATDANSVIEAIKNTEVLILNKDEALEIVNNIVSSESPARLNDELFLIETLTKLGPKIVSITDGVRGAWVKNEKEIIFAKPTEINALDTTGSGDAFTSGFLGAIFGDKNVSEALAWGIVNGENSVKEYGGQKGLLSKENICDLSKKIKIEKIK